MLLTSFDQCNFVVVAVVFDLDRLCPANDAVTLTLLLLVVLFSTFVYALHFSLALSIQGSRNSPGQRVAMFSNTSLLG